MQTLWRECVCARERVSEGQRERERGRDRDREGGKKRGGGGEESYGSVVGLGGGFHVRAFVTYTHTSPFF